VLRAQEAPTCPSADPSGPRRSSELAAALLALARVQNELGESTTALATLDAAHLHASACEDLHRDADARILAAKILVADLGRIREAEHSLDEARVALWHVGEPAISLRRYEERMAASLVAVRKDGSYEAAHGFAEAARRALGDHDDPILHAKLLLNIGVALQRGGRFAEADTAYQAAIAQLGKYPALALLYSERRALNLGLAAVEIGDVDAMRIQLEKAAASSDPTIVAKALSAWAQGEYQTGDRDAAAARTMELLEFLDTKPSLPPITAATAETTAGQILVALHDPLGIEVLEQACPHWRELGDVESEASCQISRGGALYELGRNEEAKRVIERLRSLNVSEAIVERINELEAALSTALAPASPRPQPNDEGHTP
jgi:tetratricopeptide (TPR) repeat protein